MIICLERCVDLLMRLPLTVSCFSKIQTGFFMVPAHPGSPGQRAVKRVCVCVCVSMPTPVPQPAALRLIISITLILLYQPSNTTVSSFPSARMLSTFMISTIQVHCY